MVCRWNGDRFRGVLRLDFRDEGNCGGFDLPQGNWKVGGIQAVPVEKDTVNFFASADAD